MIRTSICVRAVVVILFVLLGSFCADGAEEVTLAEAGNALYPIVVSREASEGVRTVADTLARYLGEMAGTEFPVTTGSGETGLAVGLAGDFEIPEVGSLFDPKDIHRREEYLLRSHAEGLWLIGATDLAAEHAVWDLLHRLGYRQFFPGPTWEIVPQLDVVRIAVDDFERPAYYARRIWYGWGPWDYAKEPYAEWCARNRCVQGIALNTGHAYGRIVKWARDEFDAHPEYWPLLDGERKKTSNLKPCLGNPEVRALFVKYALERFESDPSLDSVSMDPSDGGGWCECALCEELGTVTDRVVTVANEVAEAVDATFPGKLVGMYAYNYHSPPPTVRVHPNVVVSVATAFIKGGYTLDDLISGWSAQGATLGIREYYSVNTWDRDQPAHTRGGNLDYLRRTIPEFYAQGARYMSAESSDNWGPNGLGYYLAARMLWDPKEAERIDALVDDFLDRAFGPAKEPMREFYDQIDGSNPHLVIDDQLGRMYRALRDAREKADTSEVRDRIDDLTLYARYCSLYYTYKAAKGEKRQAAFEALIRHAYRMRKTMLVHTKALYRDLVNRDKTVTIAENAAWNVPEEENAWKSSEPFSETEIAAYLEEGIDRHELVKLEFEPRTFSMDLAPAAEPLDLPTDVPPGKLGPGRRTQTFYTYVAEAPAAVELGITGGLIEHYRDRGNVKVALWQLGGASETGEGETLVASDRSVPPDGIERTVRLPVNEPGLYRITISDGGDRTRVTWPESQPMALVSSQDGPMSDSYRGWMAYFYVPKGTTVVGFFGGGHGEVRDSHDRPQFWLNGRSPNYYSVPVPEGEDGRVWHIRYANGAIRLLTVPPCLAITPRALLLPQEVVEKDAKD
ncbi:MAG: DUF4838 domain-containing protein [Candidatus Hydrogenedentota bacterium]